MLYINIRLLRKITKLNKKIKRMNTPFGKKMSKCYGKKKAIL
jgi:hypothetical protein